jgi:hypothetical protein
MNPDHTYWSRLSFWKPEDAAALALGCEPRAINPSYPAHCLAQTLASKYLEILEFIRCAIDGGDLKPQLRPMDFLSWTRKMEITMDADLAAAIEGAHRKFGAGDKTESPRKTALKILATFARLVYGWNPLSPRSTVAKAMADDCDRLGLGVSEETIRNRLNEAKEVLDLHFHDA